MQKDEMLSRILELGMQGLLYHCFACIIYNVMFEKSLQMDLSLLILYLPLMLFAIVREKCAKFAIFMLFHVAIGGIFILLIQPLEKRIVLGICVMIMLLLSISKRLSPEYKGEECPPIATGVLFLLGYVSAQNMHRPLIMEMSYYEAFFFLILFAIHKNYKNTSDFLKSNKGTDPLFDKQIRRINKILISIFIVFLILGMLIMPQLLQNHFPGGIGEMLRTIIRGILTFIIWLFSRGSAGEESAIPTAEESMQPMEMGETSVLAQIIERILMTAFYILLVIGLVYLVVKLLYTWYKRFYERQNSPTEESEFLWKSRIKKERTGKKRKKTERFVGGDANQKIRYMYKKHIRRQFSKKHTAPTTMTPIELETYLAKQKAEEIDSSLKQRVALYEKARYSQWKCDKQEVETMKQNIRDLT